MIALRKDFMRAGTRGLWHRPGLAALRAGYGAARAQQNARLLDLVKREVRLTRTGRAALDWAERHGIEFIVDHETLVGGYYCPGTGVVALGCTNPVVRGLLAGTDEAARLRALDRFMVEACVHEIRHAWQDYHGLLYHAQADAVPDSPVGRDLVLQAVVEADAFAHGVLADREYGVITSLRAMAACSAADDATGAALAAHTHASYAAFVEKPAAVLTQKFIHWFGPLGSAETYGRIRSHFYARALGLVPPVPVQLLGRAASEYHQDSAGSGAPPADFSRREVLDQLGRSFAGVNYLTATPIRDQVIRMVLPHSCAERSFRAEWVPRAGLSRPAPDEVTQRIRRIRALQTRARLKQLPKRLPLP